MNVVRALAPIAAAVLALPARAGTPDRLVVLIENQTASAPAKEALAGGIARALKRKGYEVIAGAEVDAALAEARVAHVEELPPQVALALQQRFQAARVLAVTIRFFLEPAQRRKGPDASAAAGFTARAFAGGKPIWQSSLAVIDDLPPVEGGPRKPLVIAATARLLWSFPNGMGPIASDEQEFENGAVAAVAAPVSALYDYDVRLERLRAARTGPRFRMRMDRPHR